MYNQCTLSREPNVYYVHVYQMKTNSKKEMYLFVIIIDPTCTYSYMVYL